MITKKILPALLITAVLAASVSTSASAHDRGGNNGLAIAAGIIGAVAIGTVIANANSGPSYAPPQQVYQPAPQPVYYQAPQQVYYQPAPVYVRPAPVYVEREYRERPVYREYRREYRDVYYTR
ncbi:hypothetical protein hmeg3_01015 [Herbaspirillum sp. meg3]|uniref:hypothetical protein n=1 Tax=Herbaspirillum sp. meg3 TaxID=2025949 RepID=UPI000B999474|nr:hypothetical protein [Herbaspirillum sp. meg3]ASU37008.1 hypothetical protein hmeg3_01015 [Herbaspirillum sp. meg3]